MPFPETGSRGDVFRENQEFGHDKFQMPMRHLREDKPGAHRGQGGRNEFSSSGNTAVRAM